MGGNAFKEITRRVTRQEVLTTAMWLRSQWPEFKGDLRDCLLGSAGKNETSGDIDLNIDIELYDLEKVAIHFSKILGSSYVKSRPGNNQIFMAVPINGVSEDRVQVDLMFGDFKWQEFSYYSAPMVIPGEKHRSRSSRFKGLYRTELLKALTAYNSDWVLEENDEVIARVGPTFFHDRGCVWRYRHRPMRQDGTARVKEFKELSKDEFLAIYPGAVEARCDVIKDTAKFIEMILPNQYYITADRLNTFEDLWYYLRYAQMIDTKKLLKIFLERLNNLNVEIPTQQFSELGIKV